MALPWAWSCPFGNDVDTSTPRQGLRLRLTRERWCGQPHRPPHYGTPVSITEDAPVQARPEPRRAPGRAAAWWWLVTACVVILVVVAATLAIWWAASRETRTTSYRVLGDLAGIRLDLGDADVEIDGGATAVEVRRVDRFAYGAPSRRAPLGRRRHAEHQLALPGPGARLLPRLLPARGARQRPARRSRPAAAPSASRACARRCRSTPAPARSPPAASAASSCARPPTPAASARSRSAPPTGSSCARAPATCARSSRPAATRSTPQSDSGTRPHPRTHQRARRAVPDPGAEHERRRLRRGRLVTVALDLSPHLRAARRALLYLVVGLGQGLTYLLVIGGGLVLGVVLDAAVGRPADPGAAPRASPGGWPRASAARPTACSRPTCRRSSPSAGRGVREQLAQPAVLARRRRCCCSSSRSRSRG